MCFEILAGKAVDSGFASRFELVFGLPLVVVGDGAAEAAFGGPVVDIFVELVAFDFAFEIACKLGEVETPLQIVAVSSGCSLVLWAPGLELAFAQEPADNTVTH